MWVHLLKAMPIALSLTLVPFSTVLAQDSREEQETPRAFSADSGTGTRGKNVLIGAGTIPSSPHFFAFNAFELRVANGEFRGNISSRLSTGASRGMSQRHAPEQSAGARLWLDVLARDSGSTLQADVANQASSRKRFLGIDLVAAVQVFLNELEETGSVTRFGRTEEGTVYTRLAGFEAGAIVRFFPWLGITGRFARNSAVQERAGDLGLNQYLVGAEFTRSSLDRKRTGLAFGGALFAHFLVGVARASYPELTSESGFEFVFGGGIDIGPLRLELDYVRLDLNGFPANNTRGAVGVIFPFCLKGCYAN